METMTPLLCNVCERRNEQRETGKEEEKKTIRNVKAHRNEWNDEEKKVMAQLDELNHFFFYFGVCVYFVFITLNEKSKL